MRDMKYPEKTIWIKEADSLMTMITDIRESLYNINASLEWEHRHKYHADEDIMYCEHCEYSVAGTTKYEKEYDDSKLWCSLTDKDGHMQEKERHETCKNWVRAKNKHKNKANHKCMHLLMLTVVSTMNMEKNL